MWSLNMFLLSHSVSYKTDIACSVKMMIVLWLISRPNKSYDAIIACARINCFTGCL